MDNNLSEKTEKPSASAPAGGAFNILKNYFQSFRQRRNTVRIKRTWRERVALLTFSQWTYFAAFILFLFTNKEGDWEGSGIVWVGLIAGIGLSREIWHLFHRIWHTMLGKGVLLVLYAATANLALAMAAMKVNIIPGIEPTPLKFTLGFTTLIMLPMWIFTASVLMSSVLLMAGNLWLLLAGFLRLIRIKVRVHWEDQSFAFTSMILRIILLPIVISALYLISKPYVEQVLTLNIPLEIIQNDLTEEQLEELRNLDEAARAAKLKEFAEQDLVQIRLSKGEAQADDNAQSAEDFTPRVVTDGFIDKLIAAFIFHMETYSYSSCAKEPYQRVLTIDDYSMLVAEPDENNALGYSFSIAACRPVYEQVDEPAENTTGD